MKRFLLILTVFLGLIYMSNCEKEDSNDKTVENDSIALNYVDLNPDTNWIDIANDSQKDIILYDTIIQYGIPGDTLFLNTIYIKSINESISISWGRDAYPYAEYLLEYDSIVGNSLVWESSFLIWGPSPWMNYGHDPNYIGIRYFDNNDTLYGWIYKINNSFVEYAIDTTQNDDKKIYAGHKYK